MEQYATECRAALRQGGGTYSKWFFDERGSAPDLAFFRSFESSPFKGGVHDYFVYFEVHLDADKRKGDFNLCTLEVGTGLSGTTPSHSHSRIFGHSISLMFETGNEKHRLEGFLAIDRNADGCVSGLRTVNYTLTHIHPGTKQPTKMETATETPAIRRTEITCPKCLGNGQFNSMSIPKEAYEQGLSGYALYSENRVSGCTGCSMCGGGGTVLEDWFIREKGISTKNPSEIIRGRGRIVIGRGIES